MPFSRELYIEREDFMEEAPKKFFRLTIGGEVRLKSAYIIKANRVEKDENGEITTIYASYDEESKSGSGTEASMRKVKGGKTDEQGHYRFHVNAWDGNILNDGLKVKQTGTRKWKIIAYNGDVVTNDVYMKFYFTGTAGGTWQVNSV